MIDGSDDFADALAGRSATVLFPTGPNVTNHDREGRDPSPVYVAQYEPDAWYDSIPKAIDAVNEFRRRHPPPSDARALLGQRIRAIDTTDRALALEMTSGGVLLIENVGDGGLPRISVSTQDAALPGRESLGEEVRLAWHFPHGDPARKGRERSGEWTWFRREELTLLMNRRLTDLMIYPGDVSLYFHDDYHIFSLESVHREGTRQPVLLWSWSEWRGRCSPAGRPSLWE